MDLAQRPLFDRIRTKVVHALWSRLVQWRVRLFQRGRHQRLVLERVAGRPILVLPEVFNPELFVTGAFLATILDSQLIPPGANVLDMGTGSGVSAVFAACWADRVVAVDINPAAVRCARINALLNEVDERVTVRQGDLFAPVAGDQFDVVLFNPPFFRGAPRDAFDHAWRSTDTVERFAAGLRPHLAADGYALVLLSTVGETPEFLTAFRTAGFTVDVVVERDVRFETLTLYRLEPLERNIDGA